MNREQYNKLPEQFKKFFDYCYVGERHGEDGSPYKYSWNSLHPEIIPTTHVELGTGLTVCPYCGERMYPIQAGIKDFGGYLTTGYACFCEVAQQEIQYKEEKKQLEDEYKMEISKLACKYSETLKFDREKLLKLKYEADLKLAKRGFGEVNAVHRHGDEW